MDSTLLSVTKQICRRLRIPEPSTVISNTDRNIIEIRQLIESAGRDLRDSFAWPELQSEFTFTLTDGTANYPLPYDLNFILYNTMWDRSSTWPLIGPLDASQWQERKSGIVSVLPRQRFRVKGFGSSQFYVDPTPGSGDTGKVLVFEYCNATWIKPVTPFSASYVATTGQYLYTNLNVYKVLVGGTTGMTEPTGLSPTSGTANLIQYAYDTFLTDSDTIILNVETIADAVEWMWRRNNGFEYEDMKRDYLAKLDQSKTDLSSAGIVNFGRPTTMTPMLGAWSIPDSGYGS